MDERSGENNRKLIGDSSHRKRHKQGRPTSGTKHNRAKEEEEDKLEMFISAYNRPAKETLRGYLQVEGCKKLTLMEQ